MARRKVVFVIVEGPSDDTALGVILERLYGKNQVHVEIIHGDITSDLHTTPGNITKKLGNLVRNFASSMHFDKKDFQQVIHIVDMDGAYIPEKAVIENEEAAKPLYSLTGIQTVRPAGIVQRNQRKQSVLDRISGLKKVWTSIPYAVYYMSCNLDHVLYNKLNSTDDEKEEDALRFARKYKDDLEGFLSFISDSDFARMEGYSESWEFVKKDLNSLGRFSNLGLCFVEIRSERYEQSSDT